MTDEAIKEKSLDHLNQLLIVLKDEKSDFAVGLKGAIESTILSIDDGEFEDNEDDYYDSTDYYSSY